ncbi:MAG: putative transcriptional regulator of viral defense system [Bdellovibrionota bacterium]|jgi:predicted transcriptional regulator of viral defense system
MSKYVFPEEKTFIRPVDMRKRYGENYDPNIFKRWADQGRVEKLRNGLYLNTEWTMESEVDAFTLANEMYTPSYVSTYSALQYHSIIPEHVFEVTSVSTRKTKAFVHDGKRYDYRTVKSELFFGFDVVTWRGNTYSVATPEKALFDLAYLEPDFSDPLWLEEMRFDTWSLSEDLNWDNMFLFAHKMNMKTVYKRISLLLEVYDL